MARFSAVRNPESFRLIQGLNKRLGLEGPYLEDF